MISAYVEDCVPYTLSKLQNILASHYMIYVNKLSVSEILMSARE